MNVSIEGVINNISKLLRLLNTIDVEGDISIAFLKDEIVRIYPGFHNHIIKEFLYNLKLFKTEYDKASDEEKFQLVNQLCTIYCIKPFTSEDEQQKMKKELDI